MALSLKKFEPKKRTMENDLGELRTGVVKTIEAANRFEDFMPRFPQG